MKRVLLSIFILCGFLFLVRSPEMPSVQAMLYPGLAVNEIEARRDSLEKAFFGDASIRVDKIFEDFTKSSSPGAAVAVIQNGIFVHKNCYGLANLKTKEKIETTTRFLLASVSKQFTAMAIMMLKEEGKLSYDDPIYHYFPEVPSNWRSITIRHLLTHTSGIPDRFWLIGFNEEYTNQDVFKRLIQNKALDFKPGTRYKYSNSGYDILALLVEKISKKTFPIFLQKRIFDPLQMSDTMIFDETKHSSINHRAIGYRKTKNTFRIDDYMLHTMGESGIFSTIEDLYKWDQCLYTEQLVSFKTLEEAFSPQARVSHFENYGFGWRINNSNTVKTVSHTGTLGGISNIIFRIPQEHFTIIILSNASLSSRTLFVRKILEIYHPDLLDVLNF